MQILNAIQRTGRQFDPSDFVSVSNQCVDIPVGPQLNGGRKGRVARNFQKAKQAGLWNLHECFPTTTEPTVGIEIELYLVEARSGELAPRFDAVYRLLPKWAQRFVKKEAFQFQIEIATGVHPSVETAGEQLEQCLAAITDAADRLNLELLWQAGIQDFEVDFDYLTDSERTQSTMRRQPEKISLLHHNGMHVHVGVARDQVIRVCDAVTAINDQIIGMAANSQIIENGAVVCQSQRCQSWLAAFPTLPKQYYRDWSGFYDAMLPSNRIGIVLEPKDNYAWVRPTTYGTCEIRTADLPKDLATALHVAEFIHNKVRHASLGGCQILPSLDQVRNRCQQAARLGTAYQPPSKIHFDVMNFAQSTNFNSVMQEGKASP
ncbi:MAG: glutamate-cysteine ligase family protein [Planctomycetota bacterium]